MTTVDLFATQTNSAPVIPFAGAEYDDHRDRTRLFTQIECIVAVVILGEWWTIQRLTAALRKKFPEVGFPENSVQAQLRNLVKVGYQKNRRHVGGGLFEYQILNPNNPGVAIAMRKEKSIA